MTQQIRRYTKAGPAEAQINAILPGGATVSNLVVSPSTFLDVTLSDDAAAQDLDDHLATEEGWDFSEADPQASAAKTIKQIVSSVLSSDASQIAVPALQTESDWIDVVTRTLTTKGGTSVGTQVTGIGTAGVGEGRVRLLVDGGDFSDQVIGADYHGIAMLTRASVAFHHPVIVPSTQNPTEYTFKLQMQATGLLGTLTPRKGCALTCAEYVS